MPSVVEHYVRAKLRQHWRLSSTEFPDSWKGRLWLDSGRKVQLIPDLGVYRHGEWQFVGDVKYKSSGDDGSAQRNDIYQMLAYLTATGLDVGTLIYAGTGAPPLHYQIDRSGATINVESIDLNTADPLQGTAVLDAPLTRSIR